jgi:NAD(P)-dependent dehydrogenase (short-subunit alcohol dehydrogenase family)
MDLQLTNKLALVSGSTGGIGLAIATSLAAEAEIPDDEWRRFFEINVLSGVRLSRLVLPGMKERNWGRIIFISSESAIQPPPEMLHYGMTKTAQIAVARGLAELMAGTGVTVNSVLPGPTRSEGVEEFVDKLSGGKPFAEFEKEFF